MTATLDHPSSQATTVTVSAAPVTPAVANDYTLSTNTTLTIAAGATTSTGVVTITAVDNTVYEGDKTVTVAATATNDQGVTAPQDVTLTITEDDTAPVVTVAAETATVTEGGDAVFILTRASADITTPLVVDFTVADPNTVLDQAAPTTATIPDDETTVKVTLATDDDAAHEADATVTLTVTDGDIYDLGTVSSATVTVEDDDPPGRVSATDAAVTVAADEAAITEGGDAVFTLTRTEGVSEELVVTITVTGGGGVLADEPPTEATFGAGAATTQVTLATAADEVDEPDGTVTLTVTDGDDYYPGDPAEAEITVQDDDDTPKVTLVLTPPSIGEAGGKSTVTASLDRASSAATTVTVAVTPVTPAVAGDYMLSGTALTIAAGETTSTGTVTITAVDNDVDAADKEVTISATAENEQGITNPDAVTLTITDDEVPVVTVAAETATVTEGEEATFTLTRVGDLSGELAVTFGVTGGGAVLTDTPPTGATFGANAATVRVALATEDDQQDEPNATLTLALSDGADYDLGTSSEAEVTVEDNDDAPTVTLVLDPATIGEAGGKSTVTATLAPPSSQATTVTVTAAPVDPAVAGDYTLSTNTTLTIASGQTTSTGEVTITAVDNAVDALDKEVTVSATATNAQGVTAPPNVTLTITDDDAPELSIGDASVGEGDEGTSATLTFTVTLSPAATLPVTVDWKTADGTAEAGTDYTTANGALTFNTGDETKTVTVTVTGDDADEPNETITVTLTNESGATLGDATGTGTITDDDDAPTVTLVLTPASISENGGKSTVTATLDRPSSAVTTVTVAAAPVSPAVAGDYTLSTNTTLTIASGQTTSTGEVTITAVDNAVDALDKELTVSATAENTQGITAPPNATLTITDDDAPELSIDDASVTEGDDGESATLTFTVTLDPAATLPVTVDWATSDGTAEAGTDYTAGNGSLTFDAGDDTKTVTVTVTGDDADEPNETLTVTLTNAPGATITDATGTGKITDDDGPPAVTLVLTPASITEAGGKSTVTATLDHPSSQATTVTVSAAPVDPAVAGDYTLSTNTTLTIAAGDTTSTGEVTITAVDNDVDALDKEVTVSATAENTQGITAPQDVTLTIEDDDAPELAIGDASVGEGDSGDSPTLTFTVTLSPAATLPVTVDWATADGTAEAGTDYTAGNGSLKFDTGDETKTITVTVTGDDADEPNETLTVTLTNESGATLGDATGTGTITDDDDEPTVTLVLTPATIGENGGKSTVTATLDHPSSQATTVTVAAAPVSPAVAGDYTLSTNKTLTIAAGQTTSTGEVTITAVNNEVDALDKELTVSATATNSQGITAPQNVTLTIEDDDAPSLSINDASVAEGDQGASATLSFTVTLSPAATLPVTVDWATSDGTATAGTDYTAANGSLTFNTGENSKTVTVTVTGDDADEPNETITVTLSNESGATLTDGAATGTITDDDDAPTVTLVLTPASIGENGGKSTVTATLDHPSSQATTVTVSAAPVDPAVAGDYTLSTNTTLTIAADATTSTGVVTITAVNNDVDALDKEVTVSATATNSQGITAPQNVTLTITDDDAPSLSINDASVAEGDQGASATLTFTVTLDPAATLPVTVDWKTSDGTATAGTDYTAGNGSLTFATGDDTKTVTVTVTGDDADEPNETLTVTLTNESGATITDATGTGTITDDDGPPAVTLVLTPTSITEAGGKSTVTATLNRPSSAATTVTVTATLVTPAVANDYTLVGSQLTIPADSLTSTGAVTITAANNTVYEGDKTVTVSATATNDQGVTAPQDVTLTITEDDAAPVVTVAAETATVTEGGDAVFILTRASADITTPLVVDFTVADPNTVLDQTAPTTATIPADQTTVKVTLATDDDAAHEADATVTLTVTDGDIYDLGTVSSATVTVEDDDPPGRVSATDAAVTVAADEAAVTEGGDAVFTLTRTEGVSEELVVTIAVTGGEVLADEPPTEATFGAGAATTQVTLATAADEVDEPDATLTVTVTDGDDYYPGDPAEAETTVQDDDDTPKVTLVLTPPSIGEAGGKSTVTASLDRASSAATTVTVAVTPVDPAVAGDYTLSGTALTIAAGATTSTGTVTITAVNNDVDAADRTVTVSATAENEQGITNPDAVTLTITDDEVPVVTVAAETATITEGEEAAFTLTRAGDLSGELAVTFGVTGGGAVLTDTPPTGATFGANAATVRVALATEDDQQDEPNATLTLALSDGADYDLGTTSEAEVTVEDNDDAPTVRLVLDPATIGENGGKSTVTATLDHPSSQATTVTVSATPVTPAVASDYTLSTNKTLTIAAGETTSTGVVTITAVNNAVDALDKEVTVSATAENTQGITAPPNATLTIEDDDAPALSIDDASVTEGDEGESATLSFTVTLSPAATLPVTVDWATSDGTAEAGTDYTAANGSLRFDTGDETKTITVTVRGDDADEPNETLTVTLSNESGATLGDATGTGTITDDDGPPAVTLMLTPASIGENGGKSTVTATLDRASSEATTVTVSAAPVSPALASDYTLSTNTTLTIAAGQTTSTGAVTLTAVDNDVDALDKEVTVSATATNSQGVTAPDSVTLTITDDDAPELSIGNASVGEGDSGDSPTLSFTVTLSPAATLPVTVDWKTADGTAEAGTDYTAGNGSLTFAAGDDTKTITVTVTGDDADEPNETLTVTLTNESGATLEDATGTGTITDDDDAPTVTLVLTPASISENGGKSTVTATLGHPSSQTTTVTVSAAPVTPAVANDYTLSTNTTLTIAAGETTSTGEVTITAVDNAVDALDKEVTVSATATNAQGVTAPPNVTLTIEDDDAPELAIGDASVTEGDEGDSPTLSFTVTLSPAATLPVTVDWATSDGTATAGTDYTAGNGSLKFDTGDDTKTVTVTVTGDDADEPNETIMVTLTNAPGATLGKATGTGTITDDDDEPTVTLVLTPASISENGGKSTVTASLDHPSSQATTVTVAAAPVSPAVAGDYTLSTNTTLTIAAGETTSTGEVTITAVDNAVDALDKEVTVSATAENTRGITTPPNVTLTITDDEPPVVTVAAETAWVTEGEDAVFILTRASADIATSLVVDFTLADPDTVLDQAAPTTATIPADESTVKVTLATDDDAAHELPAMLTLTLTDGDDYELGALTSATVTVNDNDPQGQDKVSDAAVTVAADEATVKEGEDAVFTLTRTGDASEELVVTFTVTGDVAVLTDAPPTETTFSANADSVRVALATDDDTTDEPPATLTLTVTDGDDYYPGTTSDAEVTVEDNDGPPAVTLVLTPASITEAGGKSTVTATLDHPSSVATTVTVSATPVSPALAGDYTLSTNTTLTIPAGETTSTGVVTITAVNNEVDALDKEVTVSATAENTQGITAPQNATLTITDDDAPELSIGDASVAEGDVGESATLTFTVTLDPAATLPVTVDWATSDGTAEAGTDYTAGNGSLTFDTGDDTKTITVTVTGDAADEPNETITVTLTNAPGATITDATGTGTITDDDDAPTVTLVLTPASIGENGGKSTVTATLDRASSEATTVTVSATPVSPALAGDYTLSTNTTLTIPAGETTSTGVVTITAVNNEVDALDKEVTVSATAENTQGITAPPSVTLTITDDDAPDLSIDDASVTEGDDGDSPTLTFTVTLDPAATLPVTVDWATSDGTATAGTDYTAGNGSLRFDTGDETKTITVTVTGDDADEPNETMTVTLTNAPGATLGDATGTGTITDDDDAPTVTLVLTPSSIGENGGKSTVTATLDHPSSQATTVTVAPVTPAVANDYTLSTNTTLTIAAGATTSTGVVTITAVNNEVDALDKEVTVSATATNSQGITAPQNATLTIEDDDAPALSIGDASVTEGDVGESATLSFTVTLSPSATLPVTVDWATSDGTAEAGTDYTAANGSLTFNTGEDSKTVTVTVTGDDADEPNETMTVTLTNAPGATLGDATGTGTITDDDDAPTVTLVLTPASIGEAGGKSTVTAILDHPSSRATTVTVAAAPVTPAVANDYTLSTNTTLTIAAGATTSTGVVTITAVNNEVDALDKEVTVSATATNSQGITAPQNATLTIEDDDAPALSIGDASVTEGDVGESATLSFTVTLSPAATLPVTVDWATSDGTAEAGTDYTAANGSLTFNTGEDSKTVTVTVTGDDADEPNETMTVTLTNAPGATLGKATGTGKITDDDGPPAVTLVLTPATIGENGGKSTVTATLDRPSSAATTVTVTAAPVTPAVANDYTLVGSQLTIAADSLTSTGEVTITAVNNDVDALDKEMTVSGMATNAQGVTDPDSVTLTITDDDAPELSIGDASVTEGDSGGSATLSFTVTLDPAATLPVTVDWATSDGTAEAGTDYTAANGSLTFNTGDETKTITVTVTGDDADEPNETITVTLSNESGATFGDATGTGTITDDDDEPTVTLVLTPASIGENGGKSTVTATLDHPSSQATTVTVSATPVDPAVANDYTLSTNTTLTIPAGETTSTGEVTITATDNEVDALDKEVTVSATTNSQGITAPQDATLTITDDDAPELSIGNASADEGDEGDSPTLSFAVTLDPAATLPVTVNWATSDGTAEAGTDYTAGNGSLTFNTGDETKTITVTVTGDDADEPNETFTVTLSNESGAILGDATGTGTITDDDDAPTVTLVLTPASISENGGKSTVTASLDHPSSAATTVTVSAAPVDPAVGGDYTLSTNTTLTIAAGQTTSTGAVTITAVNNTVYEGDKTVTVSATATNDQGVTAPQDVALTITEDDAAPVVTVAAETATITEGEDAVFLLTRASADITTPLVVDFTVADPNTVLDQAAPTTATILADQTTVKVTLATDDDAAHEADATVTLTVTDGDIYDLGTESSATVTVEDDDPLGRVSAADAAVTVAADEAAVTEGGDAVFTLTRTRGVSEELVVTIAVTGGEVLADEPPTEATFGAGAATTQVTLATADDEVDEPDATLTLTVTDGDDYYPGEPGEAEITVEDDDDTPTVTLVLTPVSIGENGGKSTVTASLDRASSAATTVTVAVTPVDPAVANDYTLSGTALTIAAGETTSTGEVTVTAVNNDVDAPDKEVTVSATAENDQGITNPDAVTLTITDDEVPVVTVAAETATITEGEDAAFTLTRVGDLSGELAVTFGVTGGGAVLTDTPPTGATFGANAATVRVALATEDDRQDEPNATLTLALSDGADYDLGTTSEAEVTVEDNEDAPTVTLVLTPATIGEAGGKSTVTATLDHPSSQATTVTVSAAPVTPAVANDYTLSTNTTLTIAAGQTTSTGAVTITAVNNDVDALDKTVTVSATATNTQGITAPQNVTLTIEDDDAPELSIGDASVGEGDSGDSATLTFTVTLDPAATLPVTVDWATSDGTAEAGTDYTAANGSLTFNTGDDTKTITVTVTGDDADEPNETLTVTLTNESGATLGDATGTGTITDDDGPPAVTLVLTPTSITEAGGKSTVTATLDRPSSAATTVTVSAAPVTPAVANDYTLVGSQLTIPADSLTSTGEVTITAVDNDVDALDKEVTVSATATNDQGITAPPNVTLTITDDDAPELSIGDASVTEGDSGESATLTFTVTLSPAATLPVTVDWATSDGTAEAGTDYTAANGSLRFATGDASKTFTVTVTGDAADEPNETITVTLTNASGATITDATGTGTITDDDGPPAVTLVLTPASITEAGGKSTVTASLDRPSSAATTVTVSAAPVTPAVANDYTLVGSQLTIPADSLTSTGEVTITAVDNDVDALDKEVTVSATATNDQGITAPPNVTLTITDDDAPELSIGDASVDEGDTGDSATLTFTVTLSPAATLPVTVDWATSDGTAEAGTDYTAANGSLRFATGDASKTFTVTVRGDDADEPNETLTVTLTNAPGATITDATGTGTITDDDGPPAVTLVLTPATITEAGGKSTVTATLDRASSAATTVTVSAAPVTPAVANDYTLVGSQLTIPADSLASTGTVTITAVDNDVDALDKEVTVSATATNDQGVTAPPNVTLTITDDDAPELSIGDASVTEGDAGESATLTFTVTLDPAATLPVTVDWATSDGTAEAGTDYTAANGSLRFATGDASKTFTVTVRGDDADEPNETLTVTLTNAPGATITDATGTGTITDDDGPPAVTLVLTPTSITEAGGKSTVTATLDRPSSAATTVTVSAAPVDPAVSGDYTLSDNLVLTIPADSLTSTGEVTITAADNDVDALDKEVTVSATATNAQGVTDPDSVTLTITDDDAPVVTVAADAATVTEGEDAAFTLTRASGDLAGPLEVTFTIADPGTVLEREAPVSATIPADQTTVTVTVPTDDDQVDEPDAVLTLTLDDGADYDLGTPSQATVTVRDNDGTPELTVADASAPESDDLVFLLALSPAGADEISVQYAITPDTAQAADYTGPTTGTVTFAAGETAKEVVLDLVDDSEDEPEETVTLTLSGLAGPASIGDGEATGTITDNDGLPVVTVGSGGDVTEGEEAEFILKRVGEMTAELEVTFTVTGGDAVLSGAPPVEATFGAGADTARVRLATDDDLIEEPDATLVLKLADGADHDLGDPSEATVRVRDDDGLPTVSIADAGSVVEGGTLVFAVRLSHPSAGEITVGYGLGGTATAGEDYTDGGAGSVRFAPGDTSREIALATVDDSDDEPDETVEVTLVDGDAHDLGEPSQGTGTIRDDDDLPAVTAWAMSEQIVEGLVREVGAAVSASVMEGEVAEFELRRTGDVSAALTVAVKVSERGGDMVSAAREGVRRVTFEAGAATLAMEVATIDDEVPEPDSLVTVAVAEGAAPYEVGDPGSATVMVIDDDEALLAIADASVGEGDSGETAMRFKVTLTPASEQTVTVGWETVDGTATAGEDYEAARGTLTFAPGSVERSIAVAVYGDEEYEGDEEFTVRLREPENGVLDRAEATGTIIDDDLGAVRRRALRVSLAAFGRTLAEDVVDTVGERFGPGPPGGSQLSMEGHTLTAVDLSAAGDTTTAEAEPEWEPWETPASGGGRQTTIGELVTGSSFDLRLDGEEEGMGVTVWGRGSAAGFAGRPEEMSVDGTLYTGYAGVDGQVHPDLLVGLALAHSVGAGAYEPAAEEAGGTVDATLTSLLTYLHWRPNERDDVWTVLGAGFGEAVLKDSFGQEESGLGLLLAAGGWRSGLVRWGEYELALKGDAFAVGLGADTLPEMTDVERLRVLLEGRADWALAAGSRLGLSVEAGGRLDAGAAEGGLGAEIGGGVAYRYAPWGVGVEARGRYLVAHQEEGFEDWGASLALRVDPGERDRGLSVTVAPAWGAPASSVEALWSDAGLAAGAGSGREPGAEPAPAWQPDSLEVNVGYGLVTHDDGNGGTGLLTAYGALTTTGPEQRGYRLGGNLAVNGQFDLSVELQRQERAGGTPEHGLRLQAGLRW